MYRIKELLHFCNISVKSCTAIVQERIAFYDLTMVLEGSLTYRANGREIVLRQNDVLLLPPGTLRERAGGDGASYASFNFTLEEGESLWEDAYMKGAVTPDIKKLLSLFAEEHISLFYHSREKATCVLGYILWELLDFKELPSNNPHIRCALKYIAENAEQRAITLSELAAHLHLTKEYTAFLFKSELGKTVSAYVNEKKMQAARRMIASGDYPLKEIAERLGFENYGYFARLFKRHFEVSPSGIQKE